MTRHSKNNTTAGSFTYAERQKLNYGTQSSRCSKDSLRLLTHCFLCLKVAIEPNCCPEGHLACRSCFLEDILAQKSHFKLKKAEHERELQIIKSKKEIEEEGQKEQKLIQFLDQQRGGTGNQNLKRSHDQISINEHEPLTNLNNNNLSISTLQPAKNTLSPLKEIIYCRSSTTGPHQISLKSLIPVHFSKIEEANKLGCFICIKPFTAIKACLFRACGHVVCETCLNSFKGAKKCLVCEMKLSGSGQEEVIELKAEGTGFALAGGIVESKRYDLAFQ